MADRYLTMKEIGERFEGGKTSHQVGRKLKEKELRIKDGKPSQRAHNDGFVKRRFAEDNPDVYLWAWHEQLTCAVLEDDDWKLKW